MTEPNVIFGMGPTAMAESPIPISERLAHIQTLPACQLFMS
jgi:hypothetical protein